MWKIFAQVLFKFGFEKAGNNVLWKSIKQSNSHMLPFASDIPKSKSCIFYLEISLDMSCIFQPVGEEMKKL